MKRDILPTGLNFKDIWGDFQDAHVPGPCEYCGQEATSHSLLISRKFRGQDLCAVCYKMARQGILGDPKEDIRTEPESWENDPLPF